MILGNFAEWNSNGNAVNATITSATGDLLTAGITERAHCFIGVIFTDNDGVAATPGAGTYTITAETLNNPGVFQSLSSPASATTIDATAALQTYNCAGNVTRVRVLSDSITTATKLNIKVTANAG